jgi:hypothetical protein
MNQKVKTFLVIAAKQAIIGASTALSVAWQDPAKFNLTHWRGLEHVALTVISAIGSREILVWGPKILAWANSSTPDGPVADAPKATQPLAKS